MLLSIFNSNAWRVTWLTLCILLVVFFGGYEYALTRMDYRSSVTSSKDLWAWQRNAVRHQENVIAIVGASRIQLGLNTEWLRQQLPNKNIVGLTLNGRYPMQTLEGLANDEAFNGTVIISLVAQALEPDYWEMQKTYNEHYQQSSHYKRVEAWLRANVQHRLRLLNGELNLKAIIDSVEKTGKFPPKPHIKELPDFSKQVDYSVQDKEALTAHFVQQKQQNYQDQSPMSMKTWQQQVDKFSHLVQKIHQRGGQVIAIRMPTDKGHWQLDEQYYPRKNYWDKLNTIPNLRRIHFKDYPQLSAWELADSSHLDQADAIHFTEQLIPIIFPQESEHKNQSF